MMPEPIRASWDDVVPDGYSLLARPAWQARAACRGMGPATFYPSRGESLNEAKQVCASCPVRGDCLAHATEAVERFGVWGGISEVKRRRARLAQRRTP